MPARLPQALCTLSLADCGNPPHGLAGRRNQAESSGNMHLSKEDGLPGGGGSSSSHLDGGSWAARAPSQGEIAVLPAGDNEEQRRGICAKFHTGHAPSIQGGGPVGEVTVARCPYRMRRSSQDPQTHQDPGV